MRGIEHKQQQLFSYVNLEERIPNNHALRSLKVLVDDILKGMDHQLEAAYSREGRLSIPPERFLRASLLQVLFRRCLGIFSPVSSNYRSEWN